MKKLSAIYSSSYKIGLEDIGVNNKATNKALLAIMEDVGGLHSASVRIWEF
ncbi:MAG: hypothetical protein ACLS28_00545 [Clostridium neonatale]